MNETRMIAAMKDEERESASREAARLLAAGQLVAIGTETVYGLAADAANGEAIARLYQAKGRPRFNPLIVHVADSAMLVREAIVTPLAERLMAAFWPGPLTLVLHRQDKSTVSDLATAGLDSIAIRMPIGMMRKVVRDLGRPLVAPSANRSGHVSATSADEVMSDLAGRIAAVIDSGTAPVGLESTILDARGERPILLRPGGLAREAIEALIGEPIVSGMPVKANHPTAPGMLSSHYAPRALVHLERAHVEEGEVVLTFAGTPLEGMTPSTPVIDLSPGGDLVEAAARLFAALRTLDATGARAIAVAPMPRHGLGEAINDRLIRAAAPRNDL